MGPRTRIPNEVTSNGLPVIFCFPSIIGRARVHCALPARVDERTLHNLLYLHYCPNISKSLIIYFDNINNNYFIFSDYFLESF